MSIAFLSFILFYPYLTFLYIQKSQLENLCEPLQDMAPQGMAMKPGMTCDSKC
jgi:hypothetical protein